MLAKLCWRFDPGIYWPAGNPLSYFAFVAFWAIAVAISPDWSPIGANIPVPARIVPGTVWDKNYKQSVALLADQERIGHQIGRTFVQLIEKEGHAAMIDRCRAAGPFQALPNEASISSSRVR